MALQFLSPEAARQRIAQGAALVDIRADDEYAREHIEQARHVALERLAGQTLASAGCAAVPIFYCRSGHRTQLNAPILAACAQGEAYCLEGGLDAWKKAGLPVAFDASQPIELMRQVQMAAGTLVLLGAVLGAVVSPWFHALSAFVGAGLVFAGASGFCAMARLLARMPWNRRALGG